MGRETLWQNYDSTAALRGGACPQALKVAADDYLRHPATQLSLGQVRGHTTTSAARGV